MEAWDVLYIREQHAKNLELYAPRLPMPQLPDEYRVTPTHRPALLHFGVPMYTTALYDILMEHGFPKPSKISLTSLYHAAQFVSTKVGFPLRIANPFSETTECDFLLRFYSNYSQKKKQRGTDEEQAVVKRLRDMFKLDHTVVPQWYFDLHDPWKPPSVEHDEAAEFYNYQDFQDFDLEDDNDE